MSISSLKHLILESLKDSLLGDTSSYAIQCEEENSISLFREMICNLPPILKDYNLTIMTHDAKERSESTYYAHPKPAKNMILFVAFLSDHYHPCVLPNVEGHATMIYVGSQDQIELIQELRNKMTVFKIESSKDRLRKKMRKILGDSSNTP